MADEPGFVVRVDPSSEDREKSDSAARESVLGRAVDEATTLLEVSELTSEVMRPVHDMITADASASAAAKKLIDVRKASASAHAVSRESANSMAIATSSSWGGVSSYALPPGWTAFAPPYDIPDAPGVADVRGAPCHGEADRNTGHVVVWINLDWDAHGLLVASSRVAVVLRPKKRGIIDVRPWIAYEWHAYAFGAMLSSHIVGEIKTTVIDELGNVIPTNPPGITTMFDFDNDVYTGDRGLLGWKNPNVSFPADPSKTYSVWFSASLWGDQSGNRTPGASGIYGFVDMTVQQVGVGLRT